MTRWVVRWPPLISLLGLLAGCGGMSTEDARQRCDQEREAEATQCITEAAYAQCVSCYEECGDECMRAESCPQQFICPE
ncbi:MAG TPA: hypothetical protein VLS89_05605 [Candidatus Nanopelagicales bacterium]|nr:hypothetical protein [Candidatus Nanopelagicales bacterium]